MSAIAIALFVEIGCKLQLKIDADKVVDGGEEQRRGGGERMWSKQRWLLFLEVSELNLGSGRTRFELRAWCALELFLAWGDGMWDAEVGPCRFSAVQPARGNRVGKGV